MIKLVYQTPLSVAVNAGRTCWQSQDKGGCYPSPTNDIVEADKEFLHRILLKMKHRSVAEHIRFVFMTDGEKDIVDFFIKNKFSFVKNNSCGVYYISTNLRVILDFKDGNDLYNKEVFYKIKNSVDERILFLFG